MNLFGTLGYRTGLIRGCKEMKIVLASQCRLSSTRLPGKALLSLGGKTVLDWSLASMRKVKADAYFVATDKDSEQALRPIC